MKPIKVEIADYKITRAPNSLITFGLGSCVAIALFDTETKQGGLLHVMLPDSSSFRDTSKWEKFADLAIPNVARKITGEKEHSLVAKIAGGASMFQFNTSTPTLQIGKRNIEMVKKSLAELSIPILGEHIGGNSGRTMKVDLNTFMVSVRTVNRDIYHI